MSTADPSKRRHRDEAELVVATALERLYHEERPGLLRLAVLLTQDIGAAEDVVQDAFLSLRRRWASLADTSRAGGYLRISVINGARSLHRRRAVTRRLLPKLGEPTGPAPDDGLLLAAEHRAVADAVARLPRRQRQVVALRYWSQMSDDDIAAAMGISSGAVRSHASRARARIARQLEDSHGQ